MMTLRLKRCVSLFVCFSLLVSACSPDKSSKAGSKASEFARNTEVEKNSVEKIANHAPLPPENPGASAGNNKSLVDSWKGLSTTSKITSICVVGIVAVAAVGGGVWLLGYKKGWWTEPPPSLRELAGEAREMHLALVDVHKAWVYTRGGKPDKHGVLTYNENEGGELDVALEKVIKKAEELRIWYGMSSVMDSVELTKDEVMPPLETLVKSIRELTIPETANELTKTRATNMLTVLAAFEKNVKRYCSKFL
jgi:hypothetical protein